MNDLENKNKQLEQRLAILKTVYEEKVKYIFTCKDCEEWFGVCPHSYREYDLGKYKNVYEELKKMYINGDFPNHVYERETKIQELEQKYNISKEME